MAKFVVDFEKRYRDVEKHEMKLPTGAKAYFLQQSANLTIDNERLAQATSKLEYDDMKAQIQKVFGETVGSGEDKLPIKTEECNYIKGHSIRGRGRGASLNSRNWRGRGQGGFMNRRRSSFSEANPVGIDGTVMRCHNCKSVKRFASSCPHQQHRTEEAHTTVHITLIAGKGETEQCYLLGECLGYGVLDSACTKTVVGETWVNEYLSTLSVQELTKVNKSKRKSMSCVSIW